MEKVEAFAKENFNDSNPIDKEFISLVGRSQEKFMREEKEKRVIKDSYNQLLKKSKRKIIYLFNFSLLHSVMHIPRKGRRKLIIIIFPLVPAYIQMPPELLTKKCL